MTPRPGRDQRARLPILRTIRATRSAALRPPAGLARAAALAACAVGLAPAAAVAQEVRILRAPTIEWRTDGDRPMIGITTAGESERADTLGLRIESVTAGSPAERAGLKAGDRLQSVNGISLRADRADAGEEDYAGVLTRRLQRAVQATKPGESVTLRVLSGGSSREVKVTPVKASAIEAPMRGDVELPMRRPGGDRARLGLTVASTGTARDTLGVFVQSVVEGGPAEKAGVYEGDRIAAINGVSLRVPREDAEDEAVGAMRAERLAREVEKLEAGDAAELTVVSGGRTRTVRVTTVAARDLPESEVRTFEFRTPRGGEVRVMPRRPMEPGDVEEFRFERTPEPRVFRFGPGTTEPQVFRFDPELRERIERAMPRIELRDRRVIRTAL